MKILFISQSTNHSPADDARRDPAPDARVGQLHQEARNEYVRAVGPRSTVAGKAEQAKAREAARHAAADGSAHVEIRSLAQYENVRDRQIALSRLRDNLRILWLHMERQ